MVILYLYVMLDQIEQKQLFLKLLPLNPFTTTNGSTTISVNEQIMVDLQVIELDLEMQM